MDLVVYNKVNKIKINNKFKVVLVVLEKEIKHHYLIIHVFLIY